MWILGLLFASPLVLFYTFDMVDQDNVKTPFCSLSSDPTYQLWYYVYNSVRQSLTHEKEISRKFCFGGKCCLF